MREDGSEPILMQFERGTYTLDIGKMVGNKAKTLSPSMLSLWLSLLNVHVVKKGLRNAHTLG